MADHVKVPIKMVGSVRWGDLNSINNTHEFCGESARQINENFSFAGGHRVRLYKFKKNVYWKIPEAADIIIDIAGVAPAAPPRKKPKG